MGELAMTPGQPATPHRIAEFIPPTFSSRVIRLPISAFAVVSSAIRSF
jgi:hypothetical protein